MVVRFVIRKNFKKHMKNGAQILEKKTLKNIIDSFNDNTYFVISTLNNEFQLFNGKKENYD